jgi:glycosyltransferase involved in cell wall biosynthesis
MTFSVLLCTYNAEKYIEQQLESILNQKFIPNQIIISDDGSVDHTIDIIKYFFREHNFNNFNIVSGPSLGACANFLSSLKYITSDFLFVSDQDDIWEHNKVEIFSSYFEMKDKPLLLYSDSSLINACGDFIHSSFFQFQGLSSSVFHDDSILYKNCVQGATCCLNKTLYKLAERSFSLAKNDEILMHDWWFALLAKYAGEHYFINKPLIRYRQHTNNEVGAITLAIRIKKILLNPADYYSRLLKNKKQKDFLFNFLGNDNNLSDRILVYKNCGLVKPLLIWFVDKIATLDQ